MISRRALLRNGFNAGVGLVVLNQFPGLSRPGLTASAKSLRNDKRFQAAYKRLDEFIFRHMRETGAPGMTLAMADRDGLIRTSQYGFADVKTGIKDRKSTRLNSSHLVSSYA